ncbi:D-alanyl-D-alanine carboxypeptidase family protein [Aquabacterium sp. CECT 9606]|uniref:D-alanyl-D-alanine carboxypeptidase family protein n=1 Tax=Aquabacterium sp. CECT 9606 TaxID=2845822 RepID=UPI001E3880E5|nr:D-alanyl-D-alanine carboxypeptidase family protein [Aquabacterium sp. CECT 9606]CAH0347837.1 D-alanyl-D-alanine carboxypeptidase DacC [Aquabacterium sp. CECT 9606]
MLFSLSRRSLLAALTGVCCLLAHPAWAQSNASAPAFPFATPSAAMPLPPELAARAFVLQDLSSQQTLAARNADQSVEPASLTKLMTAYLVFQAVKSGKLALAQEVPVSERAWRTGITGTSRSFLAANSRVKVDDLLRGMIVQSGNDASVALAEAVGGTVENFVALMNRQAQAFGLKATTFKNPEGQTAPGHRSTARELSAIALRLVADYPQALPYYTSKEFTFGGIRQPNRNLLLWRDPTVDGLKTSFTDASGYCLIATAQRLTPAGPRRLVSVVIGATSPEIRANESQKLLNWGYSAFDMVKLFDAKQAVTTAPVWKGQSSSVRLGRVGPVTVVVPRGQAAGLKATVVRNDPLLAPLTQGQTVGTLKITLAGQPWQDVPLTTLDAVPGAGWLGRLWDAIRLGVK